MSTPQWALERIQEVKGQNSNILDLERPTGAKPLLQIPDELGDLSHLRVLKLSYNSLTNLTVSITKLNNLTSLDLSYNQLVDLPVFIDQLHNLSTLNLFGNFLVNISKSFTRLYKLTVLNLGHNQLVDLPDSIVNLQNLVTLDLSNNKLINLPNSITSLRNLQIMELSGNGITSLPEDISSLRNLKVLNIRSNKFTNLPESIGKLKNLTKLSLDNNRLVSLPESINELQNINELNLSNNRLLRLPKLQNVTVLDLSDNQLTDLPDSVSNMEQLLYLDLSDNRIKFLSETITRLQQLTTLKLQGNPLITPPIEIARDGPRAIRSYFRQLGEAGHDRLYEAKLLILGEAGAGKTTLAKKIENPSYPLQKEEDSTEGVNVIPWSFPFLDDRLFRINIWDFGGQEIYHATHQFFLTKRSFYILVSDTRKEDTDFYYWLNVIELLSDNSPLIIVKNEKQERHKEINERLLRGEFDNLKEVLSTNLATDRGLNEIVNVIKHHIQRLPHIGSPLPKTWVRVRDVLEDDRRNYIGLDEYLEICRASGFSGINDGMQLSAYLHDIGVFLHFQDDALLRKTVILNPEWGTDAVYKVLDNKQVSSNLGRFNRADIEKIWSESKYQDMHNELLHLMMKFKLCYEIPNQKGTYIAPQLLTENQPDYEWDENENLLLRYTYEFMPKGILTQFIVVMHSYIREQKVVWKSGVVLLKDKTHAEVVEHYGRREIRVRIAGAHKKELMTIVIHELDQIHKTYKRLKYDKLIPCNCKECKKNAEPDFFKYEQLQNFVEKRITEIQCGATGNMVNIRGLIDDVIEKEYMREGHESLMAQYIIHGDYIDQGDKKMTDKKISITSSTIHGSVVAAESIRDSFNVIERADIKHDLKEQLKQLTQAVDVMLKELPQEKAEEAAEDMKKLAEEATKGKPNQKWYNVSINGLIAAAQNLGKVGDSVIELSGKVRKILTGGI